MLWSGNESGLRSQRGVTLSLPCLSGCMSWLGQGRTADAGAEQKQLLGWEWNIKLSSCHCSSSALPFPQTSRRLFKALGVGATKSSKEKRGILVCLPCSGLSENLQVREYSPVGILFPCACEIGRMAAGWEALFRGASRSEDSATCSVALPSTPTPH